MLPVGGLWAGVVIVLVFSAVNLATATLSPTVWIDEALYTDPAARWHLSGSFTSGGWWWQTDDRFWSGNVPGHQFLLCGWLSIFGFGVTAVRSMNYVFVAGGAGLLVAAVARAGLVRTAAAKIALLVLLLTDYGMAFSYRSGRPDMVGLLLAGIAAYAATLPARLSLGCVGSGRHADAHLRVTIRRLWRSGYVGGHCGHRPPSMGPGHRLGRRRLRWRGRARRLVHRGRHPRRVSDFRLPSHCISPRSDRATGSNTGLVHTRLEPAGRRLYHRWPGPVVAKHRTAGDGRGRWAAGFVALAVLLPPALFIAGRYPVYYTWMGFVPAAVAVAILLDCIDSRPRWALAGLAVACLVGLPLRLGLAGLEYQAGLSPCRIRAGSGRQARRRRVRRLCRLLPVPLQGTERLYAEVFGGHAAGRKGGGHRARLSAGSPRRIRRGLGRSLDADRRGGRPTVAAVLGRPAAAVRRRRPIVRPGRLPPRPTGRGSAMTPPARVLDGRTTISLVIPCFNEEDVLPLLFDRVTATAAQWAPGMK